jgi:hypothetical protein
VIEQLAHARREPVAGERFWMNPVPARSAPLRIVVS